MKKLSESERKELADMFEGLKPSDAARLEAKIVTALDAAEAGPKQSEVELAKIKAAHSLKTDLLFCALLVALVAVFFGG